MCFKKMGTFFTVLGVFTYFNIAKKPYLKPEPYSKFKCR